MSEALDAAQRDAVAEVRSWLGQHSVTRVGPRGKQEVVPVEQLEAVAVSHKTSTIPRRVVVVSTNADVDPPVVGEWINPDADSMSLITATRVESNTVTTKEAANSLARLTGERWARRQVSVEVTVPARPDLDYRDQVQLARQQVGVAGIYEVSGWDVQLKGSKEGPAPMRVQMLTRLG